jgi:benzoyl-CoA reductase/2-hydroxyglutaryl-CoA dehydratase subunit BcrC/BadD/HgdB
MGAVGFTTTIPVEVLLAAGRRPVDLNNLFITAPDPMAFVRRAELEGYPRTACAWIKGLYGVLRETDLDEVIVVTEGDCSQTHAMMETLRAHGVRLVPFAFPYDRDERRLRAEIERLLATYGVTWPQAEAVREGLRGLRRKVASLDKLTWRRGTVSGLQNHLLQVSCSDFEGDPVAFEAKVDALLAEGRSAPPLAWSLRLAFVGVPPIISDLYQFLESHGALVVYNEIQRQFTMADSLDADLLEQYRRYTYPYDIFARLADIRRQTALRQVDGVIHYVQAFCFRHIQDTIIRRELPYPVLTLEGDAPGPLDGRNKLRLEAFLETLVARRGASRQRPAQEGRLDGRRIPRTAVEDTMR